MDNSISRAEELARIGRENDLAEIAYEDAEVKIHITFEAPPVAVTAPSFDPAILAQLAGAQSHAQVPAAVPLATSTADSSAGKKTINSPLAGVFYRSPRPDADAFVKDGDVVSAGQTLCIVEAMKLMNEIAAENPCKIVRILVENAEAVEEGQPLFVIE